MKGSNKLYKFLYSFLAPFIKFVYRVKIIGEENEPLDSNFLICANHISNHDVLILAASVKNQICFLAKKEIFKIPLLSSLIRGVGAFPIDRKISDVSALKKTISLLQNGKCVAMYPQGTRMNKIDPRKTTPKNGAGLIIARSGCTVLPISIQAKAYSVRFFKKTYVTIGKPITASEINASSFNSEEYARISGVVFERILSQMKDNSEL